MQVPEEMSTLCGVSINLKVIRSYKRPAGTRADQKRWRFQPHGVKQTLHNSRLIGSKLSNLFFFFATSYCTVIGFMLACFRILALSKMSLFASFVKMFCWLFTCNHSFYRVTVNIVLVQLQNDHRFSSCGQKKQVCHLSSASGSI